MLSKTRALSLITLLAAAHAAADPPAVVATVDGRPITRIELDRRVAQSRSMDPEGFDRMSEPEKRRAFERVLRARIVQELEYQEARRQGVPVSDEEVTLALDKVRRRFPTDEAFRKSLSEGQITAGEWREEMRKTLVISRLEQKVSAGLSPSEWGRRRAEWIEGLRGKARISVTLPME